MLIYESFAVSQEGHVVNVDGKEAHLILAILDVDAVIGIELLVSKFDKL
jgi:hypothetical protein